MGTAVIVAYRPKPGQAAALEALAREHVPLLRRLGLATERVATTLRADDGTLVEIFEWCDGAIETAHQLPEIQALWDRYRLVCDFIPLAQLPVAQDMFAHFTPLDFA